jgi:two-component system sensor histidine kinase KdpD
VLIEQVLINLVDNATKYAPSGTPIDIWASAGGGEVAVAVADRGPGVPLGDEERVFDKFYRTHGDGAPEGAGLGLAICRAIVEAHGGGIRAEQRPGGGAVLRFTLPLGGAPPTMLPEPVVAALGDGGLAE